MSTDVKKSRLLFHTNVRNDCKLYIVMYIYFNWIEALSTDRRMALMCTDKTLV